MGFDWTPIENSFPTFREDESPMETVKKIHDYLYRLVNQLKYTLQNLDTENWNDAALKVFSESTTKGVSDQAAKLAAQLSQLSGSFNSLSGRVSEISNRITKNENEISYLRKDQEDDASRLIAAEEQIALNQIAIEELNTDVESLADAVEELTQSLETLLEAVRSEEESTVIGAEGKPLYLVGEIYINGVLYDGGATT